MGAHISSARYKKSKETCVDVLVSLRCTVFKALYESCCRML